MAMSDTVLLALYWGPRAQSLDDCAECLLKTMLAMQALGMDRLFQRASSRRAALRKPVLPDLDVVRGLLAKGVNRRDDNREPIPELGYQIGFWSGDRDDETYTLDVYCGNYSPHFLNNCLVKLPPEGAFRWSNWEPKARQLFHRLAEVWLPEQGIICATRNLDWMTGSPELAHRLKPDIEAYERLTHQDSDAPANKA
jgi:hypothetical protein